ncbi:MAG: hypothetical protein DI556_12750 [Rhodovulum sulfidophilum]|uniref:Uncharacterized protein n=1 Tax=Rhodovulum sulfidophilum TaxID=35806 RepID=A0A2W5QC65_RHOSU|nr:MAG: hypothetical protein DI556_12750 [Rhodovulum sulfidophilum]
MIELVFIACLNVNPAACEQKTLSYVEEGAGDPSGVCMRRAQPELAAWAGTHPAFHIASWTCADSDDRKVDI